MKILMLSSGARVPSSRFRMLAYASHFRAAGHKCRIAHSFPQKYDFFPQIGFRPSQKLKRFVRYIQWLFSRWRRDEIVIIDREIFDDHSTNFEERFRQTTRKLVIDLDDGVFLRYPDKFERLARMADLVVCGNASIEEWAHARNSRTIMIPTSVELSRYPEKNWTANPNCLTRMGWTGVTGNLAYLEIVSPVLRRLAKEFDFEFVVISGDQRPLNEIDLTGVKVRFIPWSPGSETEQLSQIDIGLMPLFGSEWDRYKCGFKLIQYMAMGIPAVATPVGVNTTIVTQGINGFLAENQTEWESSLRLLLTDRETCRRIGSAARKTISEKFSNEANFPIYEQALRKLLEGSPSSRPERPEVSLDRS